MQYRLISLLVYEYMYGLYPAFEKAGISPALVLNSATKFVFKALASSVLPLLGPVTQFSIVLRILLS